MAAFTTTIAGNALVPRPALAADPVPPATSMNTPGSVLPMWQTFEFHGIPGSMPIDHFDCRLDEGAWAVCTSPWHPPLTSGDHGVAVRAVDVDGLADPSPETADFFVDLDPPTVQFTINGGAATTGRPIVALDAVFTERGNVDEVLISNSPTLDGTGRLADAWSGTDWNLQQLAGWPLDGHGGSAAPGVHTVYLQAEDVFDNLSAVTSKSITFDPASPSKVTVRLAVTQNPAPLGGPIIAFALGHADDGAGIRDGRLDLYVEQTGPSNSTISWSIESGLWLHLEELPPGTYKVKAVFWGSDELDDASATITLKIGPDLSPLGPQGMFKDGPTPWQQADNPTPFHLGVGSKWGSASTYQCRIDGSTWTACNAGLDVPLLPAGWHIAEVRGIDSAGRVQTVPEAFIWFIVPIAGDFTVSPAAGFTGEAEVFLMFDPPVGSQAMRISNARAVDAQGRLVNAKEWSPPISIGMPTPWDVTDADFGGTSGDGNKLINVQWKLGDGTWTKPMLRLIRLDRAAPQLTIKVENGSAFVDEDELLIVATTNEGGWVKVAYDPDQLPTGGFNGDVTDGLALLPLPVGDVPLGTIATRHLYARAVDHANNFSPIIEAIITIDRSSPTATSPSMAFDVGEQVSKSAVDVFLSASAADTGSGVAKLSLQRKPGATWSTLTTASTTSLKIARTLSLGTGSAYRAGAVDRLGHVGPWSTTPMLLPVLRSDRSSAVKYTGRWWTASSSVALGGTVHRSSARGATATFKFTGRAIGIVAPKGKTFGRFEVYLDGTKVAIIDLQRSSARSRVLIFNKSWSGAGTHTIKVRNLATKGRATIALDGFVYAP